MIHDITDTHVHSWNLERATYAWLKNNTSILNRSYHILELEADRIRAGVTRGILVQSANNFEDTDWMLEMATANEWITGVIGWLPLMDPVASQKALKEKYSLIKYFKGVRHLIHDEPDPRWLLQDTVIESLQALADYGLVYEVVGILPEHIETALEVAHKIPRLKMVFDHLNQPPVSTGEKYGRWGELMSEAAKHDQFYVKISGLGSTSKNSHRWTADDIRPYISFVLDLFGEDRCLMGGDWPICLLAGGYVKSWDIYKKIITELLDEAGQEKLRWKNAEQFYNLI